MRRLLALAALSLPLIGLAFVASCSLGLDESLVDKQDAGHVDASFEPNPPGVDAADARSAPAMGGSCTKDDDCKTTDGCLKGRCDLTRGACAYDVCKVQACSTATCDQSTKTCGAPKAHAYKAAQFAVDAGIGCGSVGSRCFAAVWPYVFVGTTNGVRAFSAADPANEKPIDVAITGLGFVPNQIVASGSRVFLLGGQTGTTTSARVPLAYLDVPADPFLHSLAVKTVFASYARNSNDYIFLMPRPNDTAFFFDGTIVSAALLEPPLAEPFSLTTQPFMPGPPDWFATVSGSRAVTMSVNASSFASFGLINGIGTAMPVVAPDQVLTAAGTVGGTHNFASTPSGALVWSTSSIVVAAPPALSSVRAVRAFFLLPDKAGTTFDGSTGVDLEVYASQSGAQTQTAGPLAMVDDNMSIVTASVNGPFASQTSVQFVTKTPLGLVTSSASKAAKRFLLDGGPGLVGTASSNGYGYVLAADPSTATGSTVYVLDPACEP